MCSPSVKWTCAREFNVSIIMRAQKPFCERQCVQRKEHWTRDLGPNSEPSHPLKLHELSFAYLQDEEKNSSSAYLSKLL
jgi:hypothetical protein